MKTNFQFSSVQIVGKMGCTKSKLDDKVCLKDETTAMHIAYINKNGLQKYYDVMGVEGGSNHNSFDDNSSNFNLGLINIEQKSESDVENINTGLTAREWVELAIVLIIALGAIRIIYKCCMKRRKKSQMKKKMTLKEVMQSVTVPNKEMIVKTVTQQVPEKEINPLPPQNNTERQIVPFVHEKTLPVNVNVSRLPLFPTLYYS